jgi:transposase
MVLNQNYSIAKAGRKLGIKPSTAKLIVKKYKETGGFALRAKPVAKKSARITRQT